MQFNWLVVSAEKWQKRNSVLERRDSG